MKIYIKLNNGITFKIPAPIGLVKIVIGLSGFGISISKMYVTEEQRNYLDSIDLRELKKGLDELNAYRGLKMLEVNTKDGTEVTIVI